MTEPTAVRLLSPEEIAARTADETPFLRFAEPRLFAERAVRLRQLAAGHPMRDYLLFAAELAQAQQAAFDAPRLVELPGQDQLAAAARAGLPPLAPTAWRRSPHWQDDLALLLATLQERLSPGRTREVVDGLAAELPQRLDQQADRLLAGVMLGLDLAAAPLIGAALQVWWMRLVARTQAAHPALAFGRTDDAAACPCCGSRPVASVARIGAAEAGARYLHCALCQSQWHLVRIQCSHCGSGNKIFYQELEAGEGAALPTVPVPRGAVRAECCDECGHYLKIVAMDKDPHVEPVADDLASLTLDLLVSEAGQTRHGVNFLLLFGAPPEETAAGALPAGAS